MGPSSPFPVSRVVPGLSVRCLPGLGSSHWALGPLCGACLPALGVLTHGEQSSTPSQQFWGSCEN